MINKLVNKYFVVICLTLITMVEIIMNSPADARIGFGLFVLYGVYKFLAFILTMD